MHPAGGLKVWEAAALLADEVHAAARRFPKGRQHGRGDQLCRAVDSIGANLAEGSAKSGAAKANAFRLALGEARETIHFLDRCRKSRLIGTPIYFTLLNRARVTCSMIEGLLRSLGD